ncbi:tRNA(Ile)-lysidine synthetase [Pontibacillus halophilus JSM 076056 = DSM 19796]|uniref:tRNA(Ile)-lysidine synthase n=1 Tax=Pontibacillus halophilus JSM 076056 = DSM 19796 TaxID=1385510 RepID=A0A0A5GA77_9BACI|nr:tRNA(Ile)-lysidine synthetase [Pontibacillus halophilus JSM 076056 = DSM 19796]
MLVAVSGGPDSMALLHYLKERQTVHGWKLTVLTVDHQLREETSKQDVQYVINKCAEWGIECKNVSLNVPAHKEAYGQSTQVAARELRYRYFAQQMEELEADAIAFGHHGDDQVETVFMNLMRGVEPMHVHGMPVKRPFGGGELIRPMLSVTKADIEQYCVQYELHPRRDESNDEPTYTRNDFRLHVLPFLKQHNPRIHEHIQLFHEYIGEDFTYLMGEAEALFQSALFQKEVGRISFSRQDFLRLSRPLQRRSFHLILNYLYHEPPSDVTYHHWEQYIQLMEGEKAHTSFDLPNGLQVVRSYNDVVVEFRSRHSENDECFCYELAIPGATTTQERHFFETFLSDERTERDSHHFACDVSNISFPLYVRTRKPGDRIRLRGINGHKKVKDLFIDEKIPRSARTYWPIVTDANGQVLWVVGLKKAYVEKGKQSSTWLHLLYKNIEHF